MSLPQEVRFAVRSLGKSPGFTITAVVALALALAANTSTSSIVSAFLLKPLNLPHLTRLMMVVDTSQGNSLEWQSVAPADYRDLKSQTRSFEAVAAFRGDEVNLSGDAHPEIIRAAMVTNNFFQTVEAHAMLGREPKQDREVLLSYQLWTRHYNGAPDIAGKTLRLNSANYNIVGVMPKSFRFPVAAELWMPLPLTTAEAAERADHSLHVVGRLNSGVSDAAAAKEVAAFGQRLAKRYPDSHHGWSMQTVALREFVSGVYMRQYTLLSAGAVLLLLLIACANVANLQFARAIGRQKEFAVHGALGASRARILRQLLLESILISLAAGVLALPIAELHIELILRNMPPAVANYVAGWDSIRIDWQVLGFTFLLATVAGIVAGIAPAIQFSRVDPGAALKEGSRGSSKGGAADRTRVALLMVEVALSLVLLVGAALMVRGTQAFAVAGENMQPQSLLAVNFTPLDMKNQDRHQASAFYARVLHDVASIAGVQAAALSTQVPFEGPGIDTYFAIEGRPVPLPGDRTSTALQAISPAALDMLHSPLIAGRRIDDHDGPDSPPVAVISKQMAQRFWPHEDPLGKRIRLDGANAAITIVGITGDVISVLYDRVPYPVLYLPYTQHPTSYTYLTVRSSGDPALLATPIRQRFLAIAPDQPLSRFRTIETVRSEAGIGLDYIAAMLTVSGAIAFGLACVGIYGVVAYGVSQRTREIGIRVSLGARSWNVLGLVMRQNLTVIAMGMIIGLAISMVLARAVASLIFGVEALDVTVFAGVSLLLGTVAAMATLIPAWRVLGIEPLLALRSE